MSDHDTVIVIVGIIIAGSIIYGLWKAIEKGWNTGFADTILFIIILGVLWFCEFSMKTLLIVAMIAYFVENLILAFANHRNKQLSEQLEQYEKLLQLRYRECAIYQNILAQGEQRLFQKTQKISKEWIAQWDEGVRQWERSILEIKNPGYFSEISDKQYPVVVADICAHGYADTFLLYEDALRVKFTAEQIERINEVMRRPLFKEAYPKVVRLMKQNGIKLRKFVDPLTKKKRYKPTMMLLHWWLYMIDDMIAAEYEQQQKDKASGHYKELASMEIYFEDIPKYTEYETLEKILRGFGSLPCSGLCICKKVLLSLLYDISSDYKAARETFIYYKMLIDTVKEGYIAFDKDCSYFTVEEAMKVCRKRDKEEKKDLSISEKTPTFEEAYKLGVKEWMKVSNEKCDNRLIFWKKLVTQTKLEIIFGDEKVQALREAIDKEQERFENEIQSAILANKYLNDNKSYAYLAGILEYNG
ncbi:hypothetical protein [Bartonella krasnovii]|uniref:hypothetical protein n=1 Tax=Bartonella krasnovii TaxID=2267275 RepID=UPI001F4CD73D|nr:hypothetical protein [Bartonella krasnovii]UNF46849.1 hypothetical protein MNL05_07285 [Bartonella krasnovii]